MGRSAGSRVTRVINHTWVIGILGGALATIIGTYAVMSVWGVESEQIEPGLMVPKRAITLDVQPENGCENGSTEVTVVVSGLSPGNGVDLSVFKPTGGTAAGRSGGADDDGEFRMQFDASTSGEYKIVAVDSASGASAFAHFVCNDGT